MKFLKMLSLAAIAAGALMAFAGSASATQLTCGSAVCPAGTVIHAVSEGHVVLDPIIGKIECNSTVEGKTANEGSSTETVHGAITTLLFEPCTNAVVKVINPGELIVHAIGTGPNGTLTSNGAEVTVEFSGFHCIFTTKETDIGTLTGSASTGKTATLDIVAEIERTGGRSGAFCGEKAKWTGFYEVTKPDPLNIH